ncbi:hypothetical protein CEXT_304311 [Caerostris extrusa]|uniref:Neurotransmitter-gated ion-channel ligand-binding domain-containing protein n=1 Tax=Caerostris extrusa TaxID=172846 RepID=A0AAV4SGS0_CAEEX|nr:hypothetical protein CEXT_304311 [Caerostris extrusa]
MAQHGAVAPLKKMKNSSDLGSLKYGCNVEGPFILSNIDLLHARQGNPDAKRLYDDLISRYNKLVRPVINVSEAPSRSPSSSSCRNSSKW